MQLTPELWAALIQAALKLGTQAAIALANAINKPSPTIDDAISALKDIEAKGAPAYLAAAGGPAYAQPQVLPTPPTPGK